jgi:hypothetical protein
MAAADDDLRQELHALLERRRRGDLREKDFQRQLMDTSVALCRAVVARRLAPGEQVIAEHHLVHSHFNVTQSILKEPEQSTVSLFATERRLIRVRGAIRPGRSLSCDEADGTVVDELPYARVHALARRCQRRWGEAAVGLGATTLALALGDTLAVTGPLLAALGLAGVAHALLMPTKWMEVLTGAGDAEPEPPFAIHGLRRKSARALLAALHDGMRPLGETAGNPA